MKQALVPLALLLGLLVASPAAAGAATEPSVPTALSADDECAAGAGVEEEACGLNALQRRGRKGAPEGAAALVAEGEADGPAAGDGERSQEDGAVTGTLGVVSEVFTFGAPASSRRPFEDLNRQDGVFQGLRCYTENIFGTRNESHQIDGGAIWGHYKHPRLATAVLHWGRDSYFVPDTGKPDWPMPGGFVYADWGLHKRRHYVDRLSQIKVHGRLSSQDQPFAKALLMAYVSFEAYNDKDGFKKIVREKLPDSKLVAREVQNTLEAKDAVWVVQNTTDLGCTLVFTGTSNPNELSTSITSYETSYCGYTDVHVGYRNKLYWITNGVWSKIGPKLAKCSSVTCAGHSLGGSLCDVFSACANSKRMNDEDFRRQMWIQQKPELMPEV